MPTETAVHNEEQIERIPEPEKEAPRNSFSKALEVAEGAAGKPVDVVQAKPAEKAKEPDTSHIPEELLTEKKPEEKKEQVVEVTLPANTPKFAREAIDRANRRAAAVEAEREALRAELEAARKTPNEQTETELKAERERATQLEERLAKRDFMESRQFRQFETREADQLAGAKSFLDGALDADGKALDTSVIDQAARLNGAKRIAVLRDAGLDAETISGITPYLASLDVIGREKAAALENWKSEAEQMKAQERQHAEHQSAREKADEDRMFSEVGKTMQEKLSVLRRVDGQDKWNAQCDQIEARAKEIFNGALPAPELVEMSYRAAAQEVTDRMNTALRTKVKTLTDQVAALTAAQPGGGEARAAAGEAPATPGQSWNAARAKQG